MQIALWFATLLGSLFTSLVGFFSTYLTKRLALVVTVLTVIGTLTVSFFYAILALINSLTSYFPDYLGDALSLVVPYNFPLCMSMIVTAHITRWVYVWNVKVVQLRLF